MTDKTKPKSKYPGFFGCQNHDRLKIFLEDKPVTLCRNCFKRLSENLTLYLGEQMSNTVMTEHLVIQHTDMIEEILERLEAHDKWLDRLLEIKAKKERLDE